MPKEIVGVGGELHTFFGSPRSYLLICMLFVCHLQLGNKVNLLCEAMYGISFTDRVEPFFFFSVHVCFMVGQLNAVLFLSAFLANIKWSGCLYFYRRCDSFLLLDYFLA